MKFLQLLLAGLLLTGCEKAKDDELVQNSRALMLWTERFCLELDSGFVRTKDNSFLHRLIPKEVAAREFYQRSSDKFDEEFFAFKNALNQETQTLSSFHDDWQSKYKNFRTLELEGVKGVVLENAKVDEKLALSEFAEQCRRSAEKLRFAAKLLLPSVYSEVAEQAKADHLDALKLRDDAK